MATVRLACLQLLLALAATPTVVQPDAAAQQSDAAAQQLSLLLEGAVQRVLSRRPTSGGGDELDRLRARLDVLELRLTALAADRGLQCQVADAPQPPPPETPARSARPSETEPQSGPLTEPTPAQPDCEEHPSPLPADQTVYLQPKVLACARSCLQLRDRASSPQDGVYWFTGMPVPVLCDFSHDGGGWTLLLTAKSRHGWNLLSVRQRRERSPSLDNNYSILQHADAIRDLGVGDRFAYRIETQAEKSRQRWGGIWLAPRHYSFVAETPSQTDVICVRKFDTWVYKGDGIRKHMPWLNMNQRDAANSPVVLTTGDGPVPNGWGSLLYDEGNNSYQHSPWSNGDARHSGKVLYWMREEML